MHKRIISAGLGLLLSLLPNLSTAADFRVEGKSFLLDGKQFQIRSGEIHYPRVPRAEWGSRIRMAKAMGLNTICTYVFWNLHEPHRGEFDFSGEKDVAEFVKLCGVEGMHAIVRPGPYVCAEWDLGGLPAWLLAEPGVQLRSTDPRYLDPAKAWMKRMGEMLQPLSVAQGGPVLMVQVENEFGHYGKDPAYLAALEQALRAGGYAGRVFTSGGPSQEMLQNGAIPGVLNAVNFGGGSDHAFGQLRAHCPEQPDFSAEFWVGWFDHWGQPHHFIDAQEKLGDFEKMMKTGASFNLYMFHGGTTRGLWTGASGGTRYQPVTDSSDWAAPVDESGRPTEKYQAFRAVIQRSLKNETFPAIPKMPGVGSLGTVELKEQCRLLDCLPQGKTSTALQTMEELGQSTGMVAYRATVEGPLEGGLVLGSVKDRVHVMLDGELLGISGRSTTQPSIAVKVPAGAHRLDLLVENMGRVCYGKTMLEERKGLSGTLMLGERELGPFEQVSLPLQDPPAGEFQEIQDGKTLGNTTIYRGRIKLGSACDTFLDMRGFGRGIVWFNGHNLGRYWKAGPVQTIFLPGCWMKAGEENELVVLEMEAGTCPGKVPTVNKPIWEAGR